MGKILCGPMVEIAQRGSEYLDSAKFMVLCLVSEQINPFFFNYFSELLEFFRGRLRCLWGMKRSLFGMLFAPAPAMSVW
jgi:hypothetical protein